MITTWSATLQDAKIRLTVFALALDHGKQHAGRIKQLAVQIHLPKATSDIACETLPKVGISIRFVTLPHFLRHGVKPLLDRKLGGLQALKPAIDIGAVDVEKITDRLLVSLPA